MTDVTIQIARNRLGLNDKVHTKAKAEAEKAKSKKDGSKPSKSKKP
jgi:hypothetical protein